MQGEAEVVYSSEYAKHSLLLHYYVLMVIFSI